MHKRSVKGRERLLAAAAAEAGFPRSLSDVVVGTLPTHTDVPHNAHAHTVQQHTQEPRSLAGTQPCVRRGSVVPALQVLSAWNLTVATKNPDIQVCTCMLADKPGIQLVAVHVAIGQRCRRRHLSRRGPRPAGCQPWPIQLSAQRHDTPCDLPPAAAAHVMDDCCAGRPAALEAAHGVRIDILPGSPELDPRLSQPLGRHRAPLNTPRPAAPVIAGAGADAAEAALRAALDDGAADAATMAVAAAADTEAAAAPAAAQRVRQRSLPIRESLCPCVPVACMRWSVPPGRLFILEASSRLAPSARA